MIANLILIARMVSLKNKTNETNGNEPKQQNEKTQEDTTPEKPLDEELRQMSETQRMKRYVGIFFENIEQGKYQDAFDVLNSDFKYTYFHNDVNEFAKYAKTYFDPSTTVVTYDNIERLGNNKTGNLYILWLTIGNLFQPKLAENEKIEQTNFVIIEYNYNNYEMSFSVQGIEEE